MQFKDLKVGDWFMFPQVAHHYQKYANNGYRCLENWSMSCSSGDDLRKLIASPVVKIGTPVFPR